MTVDLLEISEKISFHTRSVDAGHLHSVCGQRLYGREGCHAGKTIGNNKESEPRILIYGQTHTFSNIMGRTGIHVENGMVNMD